MKVIYKITSPNGSVYIGQSNNIEKRCGSSSSGRALSFQVRGGKFEPCLPLKTSFGFMV